MAITAVLANHFKYQLANKKIDLAADSIKVLLMASGYTFNKDTHSAFANVSATELATGHGYTRNSKVLASCVLTEDSGADRAEMVCDDVAWTASSAIGPTPGAILYDDAASAADAVIGYLDFDGNQTAPDTEAFEIKNIKIRVS